MMMRTTLTAISYEGPGACAPGSVAVLVLSWRSLGALVGGVLLLTAGWAPAADPWADEVVGHSPELNGSDLYNDPQSALGVPATMYYAGLPYDYDLAVSLVAPAFNVAPDGHKLITTIPDGQFVKVKFDEPVEDHPRNPYGIDLLVFGNSMFRTTGGWVTPDTNMETYYLGDGSVVDQPVIIAVSTSGLETPDDNPDGWYVYADGPYGDGWFPTQAYEWDWQGDKWGDPKDYTTPVDPTLGVADFAPLSAAEAIDLYEWSGGGAGIDLAESGFAAIQFVYLTSKYESDPGEIDALSDVFPLLGDFDRDGDLDLYDYGQFQVCLPSPVPEGRPRECFSADFDGDRDVDLADFAAFQPFFEGPN